MVKKTPAEVADKWASRLKGATEEVRKGIDAVTESPTKKAAAQMDKLKARLLEAIESGYMKKRLEAVTLEEWKTMAKEGAARIAGGVDAKGKAKMEKLMADLLPHIEEGQKKIASMPSTTLEDSIARAEAFIRHMHEFKKKR